jgi:threonine dehydratase
MADVTLEDIRFAQERIRGRVRRTPLLTSELLDAQHGLQLYFKCENLQHGGAFKARGATNAVFALSAGELRAGVVTHSSGNHGAAVARAARLRRVGARIVMPEDCSAAKIAAVRAYGGQIVTCAPTLAAREAEAARLVAETGAAFIHPFDDPRVIAGQGTVALELLEELPQLDVILCPVGGGGLTSGIAVAVKALRPGVRVIGVEPAVADDAWQGFHAPNTDPPASRESAASAPGRAATLGATRAAPTIADGLRATVSERTLGLLRRYADDVVTVSEQGIVTAMRSLWQHLRTLVEVSSAVPYAALLEQRLALAGCRVAIILTGGNVDLDRLPWSRPA